MPFFKVKEPFIFTIFGASGDLAKLKIFPALYTLALQKKLPEKYYIVGYARTEKTEEEFRKEFKKSVKDEFKKKLNEKVLDKLIKNVYYFSGQYNHSEDFEAYRKYIQEISKDKRDKLTRIAYFSVPPTVFKDIIQNLGETRKYKHEDLRLVIEKPFGQDAESATELFHFIARYFEEEQIYLLDHYLGKTAVQSILSLRHTNRLLNILMKGPEVANIQITASEDLGVSERVGYFEQVGTIKDMVQSHLLQILALITMSIPISEKAESLHREKYSILSALNFIPSPKNLVIGQYESYRKIKDVPKTSVTETFVAMRLFIDRESWYKVPIYIRTGKMLERKKTYVAIEFEKFKFQPKYEEPNRLILELQPDEKINIRLINKHGVDEEYQSITTTDSIACTGTDCLPEHGMLLLDVLRGKKLHFLSFPEIIATWRVAEKVLGCIKKNKIKPTIYKDFSEGPKEQHALTKIDGFKWCKL